MLNYIKIIRPINLLIVALTQAIVYYFLFWKVFNSSGIEAAFDIILLTLFIFDTVLIAATGYIINDIVDKNIDPINKPNKSYIPTYISMRQAWIYYSILASLGLFISIYIGTQINRPLLIIIYPISIITLALYSFYWKSQPLIGNVVVSLFCAFVPGIIWVAEMDGIDSLILYDITLGKQTLFLLFSFSIFSFMANYIREMIKDLEDFDGDHHGGRNTLAIYLGEERARFLIFLTFLFLLILTVGWVYISLNFLESNFIGLVSVLLTTPLIYMLSLIYKARTISTYKKLSLILKGYMGIGLISLLILCL